MSPVDSHGIYRHNDQSAKMHSGDREAMKNDILNGKSPEEKPKEEEGGEIEEHLKSMHEQTGEAHTHIAHHMDGTHTSHHINEDGAVEGPTEHASAEELVDHLKSHLPEEEQEIREGGDEGMLHSHALGM